MADRQIRLFSPFSLQLGADSTQHTKLQEVLWYAESRFRQALLVIHTISDRHQIWMQSALRDELVRHDHLLPYLILTDRVPEICYDVCRPGSRYWHCH